MRWIIASAITWSAATASAGAPVEPDRPVATTTSTGPSTPVAGMMIGLALLAVGRRGRWLSAPMRRRQGITPRSLEE